MDYGGQFNMLQGANHNRNGPMGQSFDTGIMDHNSQLLRYELHDVVNRLSKLEISNDSQRALLEDVRNSLVNIDNRITSLVASQVQRLLDDFQSKIVNQMSSLFETNQMKEEVLPPPSVGRTDSMTAPFRSNSHRPSMSEMSHEKGSTMFDPLEFSTDLPAFNFSSLTEQLVSPRSTPSRSVEPGFEVGNSSLPLLKALTRRSSDVDYDPRNLQSNSKVTPFDVFYTLDKVLQGLREGTLFIGILQIDKKNRQVASVSVETETGPMKVFVFGENARNRSLEGDRVVVKLNPEHNWDRHDSNFKQIVPFKPAPSDYKIWNPDDKLVPLGVDSSAGLFENLGFSNEDGQQQYPQESFASITSKFYPDSSLTVNTSVPQSATLNQRKKGIPTGKVVAIVNEDNSQGFKLRNITRSLGQPLVGFLVPRYGFDNPKLVKNEPLPKSENTVEFRPLDNRFPFLMIQREELPKQFVDNPFSFKTPSEKLVVCAIKGWFENFRFPLGRFIEILGDSYDVTAETEAIIKETKCSRLAEGFSEKIYSELSNLCDGRPSSWTPTQADLAERVDLRNETIFVIAAESSSNFPIAFHCKPLDSNCFEIGIHVADISAFVVENSPLDLEAFNRGISVDLVNQKLPLLPQGLTDEICSLLPGKDRLCLSLLLKLNADGQIASDNQPWFARSVVNVAASLDFQTATEVFNSGATGDDFPELGKTAQNKPSSPAFDVYGSSQSQVIRGLTSLLALARTRNTLRTCFPSENDDLSHGHSFKLLEKEVHFTLDHNGEPSQVYSVTKPQIKEYLDELEILANYFAAEQLVKHGRDFTFLLKQKAPEIDEENFLWQVLCLFGLPDPRSQKLSPESFQKVFSSIERKEFHTFSLSGKSQSSVTLSKIQENFRHMTSQNAHSFLSHLLRKTMPAEEYAVAESSTLKISGKVDLSDSNWLLNVPFFTSFTAPFDRYADITVHRLLLLSLSDHSFKQNQEYVEDLREKLRVISAKCNRKRVHMQQAKERSKMLFLCSLIRKRLYLKKSIETIGIVTQFGQKNIRLFLVDFQMECKVNVFVDWHADSATTSYHDGFVLQYRTDRKDESKILEPSKDNIEKARDKAGVSMLVRFSKESVVEITFGSEVRILLKPQVERKRVLGFRTDFVSVNSKPKSRSGSSRR